MILVSERKAGIKVQDNGMMILPLKRSVENVGLVLARNNGLRQ
jgi:hypothetical protein